MSLQCRSFFGLAIFWVLAVFLVLGTIGCGKAPNSRAIDPGPVPISLVAISPDGKLLAGGIENQLKLWDPATGEKVGSLDGHSGTISCAAYAPGGKEVATGATDKTIKIWDLTTRKEKRTLEGHTVALMALAYTPDGKNLVSTAGVYLFRSEPVELKVWDEAGKLVTDINSGQPVITCMAVLPDGKTLLTGDRLGMVKVWDLPQRKELKTLKHIGKVSCLALSRDGKLLAVADLGNVHFWDTGSWQEQKRLEEFENPVYSLAFSPSGKTLATAGSDQPIILWDVASGKKRSTIEGHKGDVMSISFGGDERTLASGGKDGTIRIWDSEKGQQLFSLK
jgi:WD40 repeat protein